MPQKNKKTNKQKVRFTSEMILVLKILVGENSHPGQPRVDNSHYNILFQVLIYKLNKVI